MYNLRTELIKATISSLKIDDNPFNQRIISKKIQHINDSQLEQFYDKLFDASNKAFNGLDRVAQVAEHFKPLEENSIKTEANALIDLVRGLNDKVYSDAKNSGRTFDDQLKGTSFKGLDERVNAILSNVRPHYSLKLLIAKINTYGTTLDALDAFKSAIENHSHGNTLAINNRVNKMIQVRNR